MDTNGYWIRLLMVDGSPDGLRTVERSNWTGAGLVCPRALYSKARLRHEFGHPGVYLLLGPRSDSEMETIYIGEGDPVGPRVDAHNASKDFWTRAVLFVTGDGKLNKAKIEFLEARLVSLAKSAKRAILDNANTSSEPTLAECDRVEMEVFLQNMLGVLPVLGVSAFDLPRPTPVGDLSQLTCEGKGAVAFGWDDPQGFGVRSGSSAVAKEITSLKEHFPIVSRTRAELLANGVLTAEGGKLVFTKDYTFNSPSLAAAVVLGNAAGGLKVWKDTTGRTLSEIRAAQMAVEAVPK